MIKLEIPGYRIEKKIAEGGMAAVFLAIQESLNRKVALKVLEKFDRPNQSQRFINEGRIIASLNHHNIITIYDIGVAGSKLYIAMEYLEGGDLEGRIQRGVKPVDAIRLVREIAHCLDFIHGQGIIHRDIKPANVLFDKGGAPILTDFGIAKHLEKDINLTMDGTAMGSPDYLSPEQAECKPLDGRTDIYSLGIVLHEMLTGHKPYKRDSYIETVMAHITSPIPDLPSHLRQYQRLLDRMIAKKPADRFDSASGLIAYLDTMGQTSPAQNVSAKVSELVQKLRRRDSVETDRTQTVQILSQDLAASHVEFGQETSGTVSEKLIGKAGRNFKNLLATGSVVILLMGLGWTLYPSSEALTTSNQKAEAETSLAIARYAMQANFAMDSDRLTIPAEDNAYFYYQKIIAIDPENTEALNGIADIASRYADMAEWQLEKRAFIKARHYVRKGLGIQPKNHRLIAVEKNVTSVLDAEVEQYLLKARIAIEADKLTSPAQDNAHSYYQKVLELKPEHEEALDGLTKIADRYADMAAWQLGKYNYARAKRYVSRGLDVQPDSQRLLALQQRTNAIKDIPDRVFKGIKAVFD